MSLLKRYDEGRSIECPTCENIDPKLYHDGYPGRSPGWELCEECNGEGVVYELRCLACQEVISASDTQDCCARGQQLCGLCTDEHEAGCPNLRPLPENAVHPIFAQLFIGVRPEK